MVEDTLAALADYRGSMLRLVFAAVLGGIIGLEREASDKPAGFRTNLLICVGAALLTDLSGFVARNLASPGMTADPGRIAAQIVSGIGFLGAGTILQSRGSVHGLTTAATMWVVAAIGIAVGGRAYVPAIAATLLVMIVLRGLGRIEDRVKTRRARERTIRVVLDANPELIAGLEQDLRTAGCIVTSVDVEKTDNTLIAAFGTRGSTTVRDRALRTLLEHGSVHQVTLP